MDYIKDIHKAIEYVEQNITQRISLKQIAQSTHLSEFHFCRVFSATTGMSPVEYLRKRRLSQAAYELVETRNRIIDIAFNYGFESQEAFTRAFKSRLRTTPAKYRKTGIHNRWLCQSKISRQQLIHLNERMTMEPKIVTKDEFKVIGMECRTTLKDNKIPQLWQDFIKRVGEIPSVCASNICYGICKNDNSHLDYKNFTEDTVFTEMACIEVDNFDHIPEGMVSRTVPTQKYAVFTHKGDFLKIAQTYAYIYGTWLLKSDCELAGGDDFELYDERFCYENPEKSECDIYIPIK